MLIAGGDVRRLSLLPGAAGSVRGSLVGVGSVQREAVAPAAAVVTLDEPIDTLMGPGPEEAREGDVA